MPVLVKSRSCALKALLFVFLAGISSASVLSSLGNQTVHGPSTTIQTSPLNSSSPPAPSVNMTTIGNGLETSVAVNPTNPLNLVSTAGPGYGGFDGYGNFGVARVSSDGGQTWGWGNANADYVTSAAHGSSVYTMDQVASFDASGNVYVASLWSYNGYPPIWLFKSTDGGNSYLLTNAFLKSGDTFLYYGNGTTVLACGGVDFTGVIADGYSSSPFRNNVYVMTAAGALLNGVCYSGILFIRSTDGGITWTSGTWFDSSYIGQLSANRGITVAPDGTIFIVGATGGPICPPVGGTVQVLKSTDGGNSFVAAGCAVIDPGLIVHYAEVAAADSNTTYVVFYGQNTRDSTWHLWSVVSFDGGLSWSSRARIDDITSPDASHVASACCLPMWDFSLSQQPRRLDVAWLDNRNGGGNRSFADVYYSYSLDGKSWSTNLRATPQGPYFICTLSDPSCNPRNTGNDFMWVASVGYTTYIVASMTSTYCTSYCIPLVDKLVTVTYPPPFVSSVSPPSGYPNTQLTVTGQYLIGTTSVAVCGVSEPFIVKDDQSLLTVASQGNSTLPQACDVRVASGAGTSSDSTNDRFTVFAGSINGPSVAIDMHTATFCTSCSAYMSTTSPNEVIVVLVAGANCNPSVRDTAGSVYQVRANQSSISGFTSSIIEFYHREDATLLTLDKITIRASCPVSTEFSALANVGAGIWDPSLPTFAYHNYTQPATTNLTISTSPGYSSNFIIVSMAVNDGGPCSPVHSPFSPLDLVSGHGDFYSYQASTSLNSLEFSCNDPDLLEVMADGICSISSCGEVIAGYNLSWQGYDWDGAGEENLTLNGQLLASLPATDSPKNAGNWTIFSLSPISMVEGTYTLTFTHANWDCGTVDSVRNLQINNGNSIVYSNSTTEPLGCAQTLTYTFTIGTGSVGGIVLGVDKLALLFPYLAIGLVIGSVSTVASFHYRRKHKSFSEH